MINTTEFLRRHEIVLPRETPGNYKVKCPYCQHLRRHNKGDMPLSVEIREDGFCVFSCHHCGKTDHTDPLPGTHPKRRSKAAPTPVVWDDGGPENRPFDWFQRRMISAETVKAFDVRIADAWMPGTGIERMMAFPYRENGEVVNVKYRSKDKRFRQEKGAKKTLYNIDNFHPGTTGIIVEGEIDAMSLWEAGFQDVASVPNGAPSETASDDRIDPDDDDAYEYLWNCKDRLDGMAQFILATDGDAKGRALEHELARRLGKHRCLRVTWPEGCKDANDVLVKLGKEALTEVIRTALPYPIRGLIDFRDNEADFWDYVEGRSAKGLEVGWDKLRGILALVEGVLVIVTGIPGHGKTTFISNLLVNMAELYDWKAAFCSFENPIHLQEATLIRQRGRGGIAPNWRYPRSTDLTREQIIEAKVWVDDHFCAIKADQESATLDWVLERATAAVFRYGIKALVIDPYNEIEHERRRDMTETEYVSEMLHKIKVWATRHGVTVIFVAHPRLMRFDREGGKQVPGLYDISGSANWANKADLGIVVYRDDIAEETRVLIPKIRWDFLGRAGECTLFFDRHSLRFLESKPHERLGDNPPWEA